ncbi:MAG: hypothetical protein IKA49_01450 [Alistipes sp.]|nr:hypothetical protein [Alistipes sp.]
MKKALHLLCLCALFTLTGCIDRDFNIADMSGEMTVGGEELTLPLATLDKITLEKLLSEQEGISTDENGVYTISFTSFGDDKTKYEKLTLDGISIPNITNIAPQLNPITFSFGSLPSSLLFSAVEKPFELDFPTDIGDIMQINPIKMTQDISFELPSQISGQGTIDQSKLALLDAMNLSTISSHGESEAVFDASIEILEQLEKVDWVEFGCEDHPFGAPFYLDIDLKGINDVVASGTLKLNVNFPEGYYLRDENGVDFPAATHNILAKEITLAEKQKEVNLVVYLHKIDYSDHTFVNGKLKIDDHIRYSYDMDIKLGLGNYNLYSKPQIAFNSEPEYKDVEVKINHFDIPSHEYAISHTFNGIPKEVDIKKIAFTQNSNLTVSVKGLEWCVVKDNITGDNISPKIEIDMPLCMRFREHPLLDENTNVLLASTTELSQGITLSLEYIDCENSTGLKQENGQLIINEKITASIHMESLDGHSVLVSSITPPDNWNISMGIAESRLEVDSANSQVVWRDNTSFDFNLEDNIPQINKSIDVPSMIADIERIEIGKAGSDEPLTLNFKLDAGSTFPVEELDIDVAVNLGKMLRPTQKMFDDGLITKSENGEYILSIKQAWHPRTESLTKSLQFDALENIPNIADGKISINQTFPITGSAKIKSGENVDLSAVGEAKIDIDFEMDDVEVRTFTGKLDVNVQPESMMVELGLGELEGVNVTALSLNPVLTLRLKDNPTGVALNANVDIKTFDKEGNEITKISIPTISIAGSGGSTVIISTPRNAEKYSTEGVTFIAVENLSQLLKDLPDKVGIDMAVTSDKNNDVTVDLRDAADGYEIEYQYEVLLPFEFDGDIDLSYETTISGLNDTFATLADSTNGLSVGDVGLVAELGTTIPFNVVLSAWLVNADGTTDNVAARLNIRDCIIEGYNAEVDGEKRISKIDLDFDLGESGSLASLKDADGVRLKLSIYNTDAPSAALSDRQYIDGTLKLRLRNGVSLDIFELLKNNSVEEE